MICCEYINLEHQYQFMGFRRGPMVEVREGVWVNLKQCAREELMGLKSSLMEDLEQVKRIIAGGGDE